MASIATRDLLCLYLILVPGVEGDGDLLWILLPHHLGIPLYCLVALQDPHLRGVPSHLGSVEC